MECPVLLAALASIIANLPQVIGEKLRREKVAGLDTVPSSDLSVVLLLRDTALMRNHWCSFLGGEVGSDYRNALSPGFREKLQAQNPSELWPAVLESLERDSTNGGMWSMLAVGLSDLPIPVEFERRLQSLLCDVARTEDLSLSREKSSNLLRFAASRLRFQPERELRELVEKTVGDRLRKEPQFAHGEELRFEVECIASCFVEMSIVANDELQTYQRFFKFLAGLVRAWPASTQVLRPPIWSWPNKWPINRQAGYWEFEMTRRATAKSNGVAGEGFQIAGS